MHGDGNQCLGQGKKLLVPTLQQGHTCMTPLVQATAGEAATCGCCTAMWKDRARELAMVLFNLFVYIFYLLSREAGSSCSYCTNISDHLLKVFCLRKFSYSGLNLHHRRIDKCLPFSNEQLNEFIFA